MKLELFIITALFVFTALLGLSSCSSNDNSLTAEEARVVDSLYRLEEVKIQPVLDSLCDSIFKKSYPVMVDSIKKIRQEEVIKLLTE